jgi:hypothetical protein
MGSEGYEMTGVDEEEYREGVRLAEEKKKHEGHNIIYAEAGAPGTGGSWYCYDCKESFNSTVRILEPWEVI